MENKGLLLIPDISGFTKLVNDTELTHSRLIIQGLLETLIDSNQMELEISEVEGDAILFYKFGDVPDLRIIYRQVEIMYFNFRKHLKEGVTRCGCKCNACISAIGLSLKVITHYGEFMGYKVKNFNKLIGKDIIVAHQLLKNDIPLHEYWLITKSLLKDNLPDDFTEWMKWSNSVKQTEEGQIDFLYTQFK